MDTVSLSITGSRVNGHFKPEVFSQTARCLVANRPEQAAVEPIARSEGIVSQNVYQIGCWRIELPHCFDGSVQEGSYHYFFNLRFGSIYRVVLERLQAGVRFKFPLAWFQIS